MSAIHDTPAVAEPTLSSTENTASTELPTHNTATTQQTAEPTLSSTEPRATEDVTALPQPHTAAAAEPEAATTLGASAAQTATTTETGATGPVNSGILGYKAPGLIK